MREPDLLWEQCMLVECGERFPNLPQPTRKRLGKLVSSLKEIGATPEEVQARAKQYPHIMPRGAILTLAALVHNWGRCKPPVKSHAEPSYTPPQVSREEQLLGLHHARDTLPKYFSRRLKP